MATTTFTGSCTADDAATITLTLTGLDTKGNVESADPIVSATFALDSAGVVTGVPNGLTCVFTPTGKLGSTTVTVTATSQSGAVVKAAGNITITATGVLANLQLNWTVVG